jgi:hypothetical protein
MKKIHFPIAGYAVHDVQFSDQLIQRHLLDHELLAGLSLNFQPKQSRHYYYYQWTVLCQN